MRTSTDCQKCSQSPAPSSCAALHRALWCIQIRITMSIFSTLLYPALCALPGCLRVPQWDLGLYPCASTAGPALPSRSKHGQQQTSASETWGEICGSHKEWSGTVQWREATQSKLPSAPTSDLVMVGFFYSQWGEEKLSRVWFMWPTLGIYFGMRWITPLAPLTVYWWDVCLLYWKELWVTSLNSEAWI